MRTARTSAAEGRYVLRAIEYGRIRSPVVTKVAVLRCCTDLVYGWVRSWPLRGRQRQGPARHVTRSLAISYDNMGG
jgi:hypothetical protein